MAVMVAAIDAGSHDSIGIVPIPLWGKGETVVRTEPRSEVTVQVGDEVFGPVRADEKGVARVPLAIRPGVNRATTRSLDEAKNISERTIDLKVPPFGRVALLPIDAATVNDGSGLARLVAVTVDERGTPMTDLSLTAATSAGTVELAEELAPGLTKVLLRPGKSRDKTADVTVSLPAAQSAARATISLVPGRATKAIIVLSRNELSEDDRVRVVEATVKLVDEADRLVPPQGSGISVDLGRLASMTRSNDGTRHAQWVVPPGSGLERARLTVRLPSNEELGSVELKLTPSVTGPVLSPRPAPRPYATFAGGLSVGGNFENVISIGAEVGAFGRLSMLETPLYLGGTVAVLEGLGRPADVAEFRAFPLFAEAQWRPSIIGDRMQLVLGLAAGPVISDMVRSPGGPHVVNMALAGQLVAGAGYPLGPGTIDAWFRLGSSVYPFGGGGTEEAVGLPLGISLVVAYRFGLFSES
jgi:hypothetical protein